MNTSDIKCAGIKAGVIVLLTVCILTFFSVKEVYAASAEDTQARQQDEAARGGVDVGVGPLHITLNTDEDEGSLSATLEILLVLTVIALAPSILIMMTSFTRIIIVLHFIRAALGLQTTPPNQVMVGLALFLTFFIMSPVFTQVNNNALQPLSRGEITQEEAFESGVRPIRTFMTRQTEAKDLRLFMDIAGISSEEVETLDDIPLSVIIPSFIISELRKAFIIGFMIYIPFIIIDMVVASTLMSMGMMMLPPTMIAMPFKILLFIMADGWNLIIGELVKTFF
jgi:flagellar biosynthetic protein FliP